MRLRNVSNAKEIVNNSDYVVHNPFQYKGHFNEIFGNDNPIHLEVGMGKGKFIIDMALKYPDINFIGLEKYESIVCRAIQKLEGQEIKNLRLIVVDALELANIFDHEIETLYLNFSDPWPKKRHAKRRLTSELFLPLYDAIFKGDKLIIQKTDNVGLFESSIVSLSNYGYVIEDISLDLANSERDNVQTEYETKFVAQGIKINYLKARKK
jgi:tRNA (guanine-N7-)-methyltransferase